jgi:hypothetical protein
MAIALFSDPTKAEPIRRRLAAAGIPAEIRAEPGWERLWFVSKAQAAGVYLEVGADNFEAASRLLKDWDSAEGALREAVRCPECKSFRVEYPQFTRKSVMTNMALGLAAELHLVERNFYCEDCHCTWPKPGLGPNAERPHMAPNYFIEDVRPLAQPRPPGP